MNTKREVTLAVMFELVPFSFLGTLVALSEPACFSNSFEWNHYNQGAVINIGHCPIHNVR